MAQSQTVRKNLNIPVGLLEESEKLATGIGLTFPRYVRYILAQKVEESKKSQQGNYADDYVLGEEEERKLLKLKDKAMEEDRRGELKTYSSAKDLIDSM